MKPLSILLIGLILFSTGCTLQSGKSKDTIYAYDTGILWNHLYLTNDHTTCYCFKGSENYDAIKSAFDDKKIVDVYYEKYLVKGTLCECGELEEVVVTKIELN
jgi:hypothetical protein